MNIEKTICIASLNEDETHYAEPETEHLTIGIGPWGFPVRYYFHVTKEWHCPRGDVTYAKCLFKIPLFVSYHFVEQIRRILRKEGQ